MGNAAGMNDPSPKTVMTGPMADTEGGAVVPVAVLMGIILPVIAAVLYPTYMHQMPDPSVEWTRLLEMPFVFAELAVIVLMMRHTGPRWWSFQSFPRDIKLASVILVIFLFWSSVLISKNAGVSVFLSIGTLVNLYFGIVLYQVFYRTNLAGLRYLFPILNYGLMVIAAMTAVKFAFPPDPAAVPGGKIEWLSALPGFINIRHFGSWSGAIAAGLFVKLLFDPADRQLGKYEFFYFFAATMTIWSGTRAAVLAIMVTATIVTMAMRQRPAMRNIGFLALLTGAALIIAWVLIPHNDSSFMLFAPSDATNVNSATGGRLLLWQATFAQWLRSPWLGWGSGSIFWDVYTGWSHTQPHNLVLQFLVSWGVFGAAAGLWILGRALVAVHRTGIEDAEMRPLLAVLYAFMIMSMLSGVMYYPRFIMLIAMMFAILFARRTERMAAVMQPAIADRPAAAL